MLHQKLNPRILSARTFSQLFRNSETDISITLKVQGCQDAVLSSSSESRMIDVFIAKLDMRKKKDEKKIVEFSFSMASTRESESNPA